MKEIESVYRSRFPHFVQVATAIVGESELAVDAVQDAFAGIVRSRRTFRGDGSMEAWIWPGCGECVVSGAPGSGSYSRRDTGPGKRV